MAKLIKLYTDTNMAAINKYAHQLGFTGEPFGDNVVRNTYDYKHYIFTSNSASNKQHTYLSYNWAENTIYTAQKLTNISYGTNSQAEFDKLVNELKSLGAKEFFYKDADPYHHLYQYAGLNISTYQNNKGNVAKYNINIGGQGR